MTPSLILGPLLRYAGETDATVWVETDAACEVEVMDHRTSTFRVEGHNYALVRITDLEPGASYEYEVALDGERVWPVPDSGFPPSVIRTFAPDRKLTLAFGSCRVSVPHEPPYTLRRGLTVRSGVSGHRYERDALYTLALRMRSEPAEEWPDALLLLGDQVYADEVSPDTLEFIRSRRDTSMPPGEEVADFEEYTRLYQESWKNPVIRWLLSTVPTAMIFDDHDVHDDWNTSEAWVRKMRRKAWWEERIVGAFMSYWIYQHLGNLAPHELERDELLARVQDADDATRILREFAFAADRETAGTRWSFHRDFGRTRLILIDSRAGRVLEEGNRSMLDDEEWAWVEEMATGDFDHLLFGTSLPFFLPPGLHHVEAASEAVCGGAWGIRASRFGESVRQLLDLEHWAAFEKSFDELTQLLRSASTGERADGHPPASVVLLSGDVHHGYLAAAEFEGGTGSPVYQAVCSPLRNPLGLPERLGLRSGWTKPGDFFGKLLARIAGVAEPDVRWKLTHEKPWFHNHICTLEIRGREATLKVEKTAPEDSVGPRLGTVFEYRLA